MYYIRIFHIISLQIYPVLMTIVLKKRHFGKEILIITFHAILYSANTEGLSKDNATRLQPYSLLITLLVLFVFLLDCCESTF